MSESFNSATSITNPVLLKIIRNHIANDPNANDIIKNFLSSELTQTDETSVDSTSILSSANPATSVLFQITQQNVLKTELVQLKSLLIHTLNSLLPLLHPPKEMDWSKSIQTAIDSPRMISDLHKLVNSVSLFCTSNQRNHDLSIGQNMSDLQMRLQSIELKYADSRKEREQMEKAVNELKTERDLIENELSKSNTTLGNLEQRNRDALESVNVWTEKCEILNRVVDVLRADLEKERLEHAEKLKEQERSLKAETISKEQEFSGIIHDMDRQLALANDKFEECEKECHRLQGALTTLELEKEMGLIEVLGRTENAERELKEVKEQLESVIATQHTEQEWHQQ